MNLRRLLEFQLRKRDTRDIHRHDFLPSWDPDATGTLARLEREGDLASKQVAHLSKSRIAEDGHPVVNVAPKKLDLMAALLFDIAQEFCDALGEAEHRLASIFASFLTEARTRLSPS